MVFSKSLLIEVLIFYHSSCYLSIVILTRLRKIAEWLIIRDYNFRTKLYICVNLCILQRTYLTFCVK